MLPREREARASYRKGVAYAGEGLLDHAAAAYERAIELAPDFEPGWFNLGLVYKWQRRWADSLRCNRRAATLDAKNEAAWWNLGIAATALRDWPTARAAWRGFGIAIPDGAGPLDLALGTICVRLNPDAAGASAEVVWCRRIDPARAVIRSVPLPESGCRWGDVVLHDGEPKGERTAGGRRYVVFDALERWEPSGIPTLRVQVTAPSPDDARELAAILDEHGYAGEDWSASVRALCRQCSEGTPHEQHDTELEPAGWVPARDFGIAAPPARAEQLLETWTSAGAGRRFGNVEVVA